MPPGASAVSSVEHIWPRPGVKKKFIDLFARLCCRKRLMCEVSLLMQQSRGSRQILGGCPPRRRRRTLRAPYNARESVPFALAYEIENQSFRITEPFETDANIFALKSSYNGKQRASGPIRADTVIPLLASDAKKEYVLFALAAPRRQDPRHVATSMTEAYTS